MNTARTSKFLTIATLFSAFLLVSAHSVSAQAADEYNGYCLETAKSLKFVSLPLEVNETFSGWKLTFDGESIYREREQSSLFGKSTQIKQKIWNLQSAKSSGDGATGAAPHLQVKKAQTYFLSQLLFALRTHATQENVDVVRGALASCEGVSEKVAFDGQIPSKGQWINGGDLARQIETQLPSAKGEKLAPSGTSIR